LDRAISSSDSLLLPSFVTVLSDSVLIFLFLDKMLWEEFVDNILRDKGWSLSESEPSKSGKLFILLSLVNRTSDIEDVEFNLDLLWEIGTSSESESDSTISFVLITI